MRDRSPQTLWETALGQLELQVTRPNFETWLRNTAGLRIEASHFVVGVPSDFAAEWLRSRMSSLITRTVSQLLGGAVVISFQVLGSQPAAPPPSPRDDQPPSIRVPQAPALNAHLTFDSFTVVKSNRLAYRAARRVASGDGRYNPLVLFGAPGLGKTHLLHAIGHAASQGRQVILLTAQEFVDRYGRAVRSHQPHAFSDLFESCDLLLLDDLQFLTTRTRSQEQFFHVFNNLHRGGSHLVLTVESHPDTLNDLSPRLRSRLQAGLAVQLLPPSPDERLAIIQAKASELSRPLPQPVLNLIAQQPYTTIRELQGALNRITAYADLTNSPLTLEAAKQALWPLAPPAHQPPADAILELVCQHFQLSRPQIVGPSRARDITYARHIAMYLLRQYHQRPLAEIGHIFGGRDHSTVLNAYRRIQQEVTTLPQTRVTIQQLQSALPGASTA